MSNLKGKVAVVTGASKGIGASIAEHLAAAGASVVVNYATSQSGADAVVNRIRAAGGNAGAIQADVSKPADIAKLFAEIKKQFGKLDILVNNAGVFEFLPLEAITPQHFHRQFDLNVLGLLMTTQEAVKLMGAEGRLHHQRKLHCGADASFQTRRFTVQTKASVDAITVSLAGELGPKKIRVNSINPGMVETEGLHAAGIAESDFRKQTEATTPLGRIAQPADIAKAAVFFASDDAGWVTGQTLVVAGGARQ